MLSAYLGVGQSYTSHGPHQNIPGTGGSKQQKQRPTPIFPSGPVEYNQTGAKRPEKRSCVRGRIKKKIYQSGLTKEKVHHHLQGFVQYFVRTWSCRDKYSRWRLGKFHHGVFKARHETPRRLMKSPNRSNNNTEGCQRVQGVWSTRNVRLHISWRGFRLSTSKYRNVNPPGSGRHGALYIVQYVPRLRHGRSRTRLGTRHGMRSRIAGIEICRLPGYVPGRLILILLGTLVTRSTSDPISIELFMCRYSSRLMVRYR